MANIYQHVNGRRILWKFNDLFYYKLFSVYNKQIYWVRYVVHQNAFNNTYLSPYNCLYIMKLNSLEGYNLWYFASLLFAYGFVVSEMLKVFNIQNKNHKPNKSDWFYFAFNLCPLKLFSQLILQIWLHTT